MFGGDKNRNEKKQPFLAYLAASRGRGGPRFVVAFDVGGSNRSRRKAH